MLSTSEMLFRIDDVLAEISKVVPLEAGDIIATGTPAGVGSAQKPPRFLRTRGWNWKLLLKELVSFNYCYWRLSRKGKTWQRNQKTKQVTHIEKTI